MRNGVKKNGQQNWLCKECKKQFQTRYAHPGCVVRNKDLVLKMLCQGSGVRDCEAVSGMSKSTVLSFIKTTAAGLVVKPKQHHCSRVQTREQWSYVAKKEKKGWMLYAYAVDEGEIIAYTMGRRSAATVRNLEVNIKALGNTAPKASQSSVRKTQTIY